MGPLGQLNMQPKDVIIVEIDNNGKIIGSFHNKNGPVSTYDICAQMAPSKNPMFRCNNSFFFLFQISHSSEVRVGKEFTYFGSASAKHIYKMKTSDLKL